MYGDESVCAGKEVGVGIQPSAPTHSGGGFGLHMILYDYVVTGNVRGFDNHNCMVWNLAQKKFKKVVID